MAGHGFSVQNGRTTAFFCSPDLASKHRIQRNLALNDDSTILGRPQSHGAILRRQIQVMSTALPGTRCDFKSQLVATFPQTGERQSLLASIFRAMQPKVFPKKELFQWEFFIEL